MSSDRAIHLDISLGRYGASSEETPADTGAHQPPPDEKSQERFRQALAKGPGLGSGPADSGPPGPAAIAPGPLQQVLAPRPPQDPQAQAHAALGRQIGQMVQQLLVGEGRSGGARVEMALADDILPGVTVAIERVEGRLEVEFTCSQEDSRRRLVVAIAETADELAQRLRESVLVVVQTDDEGDRCRVERLAVPVDASSPDKDAPPDEPQ